MYVLKILPIRLSVYLIDLPKANISLFGEDIMLQSVELRNYGPLESLQWNTLGRINLILGKNGVGKSFFLKALYTAIRSLEEYQRGDELNSLNEILSRKLHWTFQADKIGDLVTKGANESLFFSMDFDNELFSYSFGKDTTKQISTLKNSIEPRSSNSIFLPAKEVLSLHSIILKSREIDRVFGFDETYYDLAKALRQVPKIGKNYKAFSDARKNLEGFIGGRIELDEQSGRWSFRKGNQKFSIGVTSEGVKKISILDTLLSNRYLDTKSIIFIDEPESALHPTAVSELLEILFVLAEAGIQVFLASHSYFVIKKLYLIAQRERMPFPVLCAEDNTWNEHNLLDGIPDNSIIDESIRLYEEEVELALT